MTPTPPIRRRPRGFTLIEVMISVALVLMIIYGVSKVFKLSSDAIGVTQVVGALVRDNRAIHSIAHEDFRNCDPTSPIVIISSRLAVDGSTGTSTYQGESLGHGIQAGYKTAEDRRNDSFPSQPWMVDLNGQVVNVPPAALSDRMPRLDRVGFFTRGAFRRQTSNLNMAASNVTAGEAFVWYGHAKDGNDRLPNDQFAADRVLARMCVLLKDPTAFTSTYTDDYYNGIPVNFTNDPIGPLSYYTMTRDPFKKGSQTSIPSGDQAFIGRLDVAGCTIDQWRVIANAAYNNGANAGTWYQPLENRTNGGVTEVFRPRCDLKLVRPYNSLALAKTVPFLSGSCTQFVVEYAGDYLEQIDKPGDVTDGQATDVSQWVDSAGALKSGKTDGKIDFVVGPDGSRRVRWYGLPRDVTGSDATATVAGSVEINRFDVLPLREAVFATAITGAFTTGGKLANFDRAAWEVEFPPAAPSGDYMKYVVPTGAPAGAAPDALVNFKYVCAFRNAAPQLLRVSFKASDPTGRLQEGQWYEYVLSR